MNGLTPTQTQDLGFFGVLIFLALLVGGGAVVKAAWSAVAAALAPRENEA